MAKSDIAHRVGKGVRNGAASPLATKAADGTATPLRTGDL